MKHYQQQLKNVRLRVTYILVYTNDSQRFVRVSAHRWQYHYRKQSDYRRVRYACILCAYIKFVAARVTPDSGVVIALRTLS